MEDEFKLTDNQVKRAATYLFRERYGDIPIEGGLHVEVQEIRKFMQTMKCIAKVVDDDNAQS